jgi:hypothetical protein
VLADALDAERHPEVPRAGIAIARCPFVTVCQAIFVVLFPMNSADVLETLR